MGTQEGVVRIFVTFPPILPEKNSPDPWHRIIGKMNDSEQDVATWTKSMLSDFVKQRHCDHEWRGVKDCNGVVLKDGRGDCVKCGSSSVGRVSASQAECREFESRLPLHIKDITIKEKSTRKSASCLKFATAFHF